MDHNKNASPAKKRLSLSDLVTPEQQPSFSPAAETPKQPAAVAPRPQTNRSKYPSATVYMPKRAIRLIKEIGLEEDRRISDIIADAVDEYLQKRGHPSLAQLQKQN